MRMRQVHLDFHTSEKIPGIGPRKAAALLKAFGTLTALRQADAEALARVRGITSTDALQVYAYYHPKDENDPNSGENP